jgi:gliding motility-associated-like protein
MHYKAFGLILLCFLSLRVGIVNGQSPVNRYSVKISVGKEKKVQSTNVAVNALLSGVAPPSISYSTPKTYSINKPITVLQPVNTGGAVPPAVYGSFARIPNVSFSTATGVAFDGQGNIYIADWGANRIIKITPAGQISIFAGSTGGAPGRTDGQGTSATFNTPDALVSDAAGNIYVADQANSLIRKITPGGLVTTLAGSTEGFADGPGTSAAFNNPRGMGIDIAGNIYVADQGNNKIRKITPAGDVSTYAGASPGGFQNGPRLNATFSTPTGVDIDVAGNVYVADGSNNVIRKISTAGDVSTFATGFSFPRELRVDYTGNVYVADQYSASIKRISPDGTVATITGNGSTFAAIIGLMPDGKGNLLAAAGDAAIMMSISGYTIDKTLPTGLTFDVKTGIISGTPTELWPATDYHIVAYNGGGSSTFDVNIQVLATIPLQPSIITLPVQLPNLDANNNYDPGATSTNDETPITYTSSNPAVAIVTPEGLIHVIAPGVTQITANQVGNANYTAAQPVIQTLTVVEYLNTYLPPIATKTVCDADFNINALAGDTTIPLTYTSSNPTVATIAADGTIHIISPGTTDISLYQNAPSPLYVSATPKVQALSVSVPVLPEAGIIAVYSSPCLGATVTFTATVQNGGVSPSYQWKVNNTNVGTNAPQLTGNSFVNGDLVKCVVTNTDNACVAGYPVESNAFVVDLITPSIPTITIAASVNSVFAGTPITITAVAENTTGNLTYQWYVNGLSAGTNSATFTGPTFIDGDVITAAITTDANCSSPAGSNAVTINIVEKVEAPNTFTPNNDGVNDIWNITGIASYPNSLVSIFNRYGTQVYQSRGYSKPWNGTFNGKPLPSATYYYVIDLNFRNQKLGGYITIIR